MGKHDHDGGLEADLRRLRATMDRRGALRVFAGLGLVPILGACSSTSSESDGGTSADGGTGSDGSTTTPGSCSKIPEETAGPYPGDGSNGPNVLTQSGIVRSDIRASIGTSTTVAAGVPLSVTLEIVGASGCASLAGYAVYLWHCDRDGLYSMYSQGITAENYLRGVQETDASGKVTFSTIFPAAYSGRWPHIHFEVYPSLAKATASANKVATSQLALPKDACDAVFATAGYEASVRNLAQTSLASDNVFRDGTTLQLPTMGGSVANGYTAALRVAV